MDRMPPVPDFLLATSQGRLLRELHDLYRELDSRIGEWQSASGTACPAGCGACCARYEPSVLPIEGMAVAAYVVDRRPSSVPVLETPAREEGRACVFFDPVNPHHCTVYEARPLECRLFGFAGSRDKEGRLLFRLCRDMPAAGRRSFGEGALRESFGALPPAMPDWGARLQALDSGPVVKLRDQARLQWRRLELLRSLQAREPGAAETWVAGARDPG